MWAPPWRLCVAFHEALLLVQSNAKGMSPWKFFLWESPDMLPYTLQMGEKHHIVRGQKIPGILEVLLSPCLAVAIFCIYLLHGDK